MSPLDTGNVPPSKRYLTLRNWYSTYVPTLPTKERAPHSTAEGHTQHQHRSACLQHHQQHQKHQTAAEEEREHRARIVHLHSNGRNFAPVRRIQTRLAPKEAPFNELSTWRVEAVRIPLERRRDDANRREMKFVFLSRIRGIDLVSRPPPFLRLYRA